MSELQPLLRVYTALGTDRAPTPAFVLHDLRAQTPPAQRLVALERLNGAPGSLRRIREKPAYIEATTLAHGVLGLVELPSGAYLTLAKTVTRVGSFGDKRNEIYRIEEVELLSFSDLPSEPLAAEAALEARTKECDPIKKFLGAGDFYFSPNYNLTRSAQRIFAAAEAESAVLSGDEENIHIDEFDDWLDEFDETFFWNRHMLRYFIDRSERQFIVPIIKGAINILPSISIEGEKATFALISRVGCENAGTRFNARGVNDDGAVANYVETEMLVIFDAHVLSFVQTRGSVPLYWEQKFVKTSYQVSLTRSSDATAPAFARHFARERRRLAFPAVIVCLLSSKSEKETLLLQGLRKQVQLYNAEVAEALTNDGESALETHGLHRDEIEPLTLEEFDVRSQCKAMQFVELRPFLTRMEDTIYKQSYFWRSRKSGDVLSTQRGVLRTNCLDCLDRTNFIQTGVAWTVLLHALRHLGLITTDDDSATTSLALYGQFLKLWEENGVQLSTQYAGASSSKSKYTRNESHGKSRFFSQAFDAAKTASQRLYANAFLDSSRQLAIDAVLGKDAPGAKAAEARVSDAFRQAMQSRIDEYTDARDRYILCASWNVNAQMPSANEDITPWLVPGNQLPSPDVYVIGFQEIVDLTTGNVLGTTDESNSVAWEKHIQRVVSDRTEANYVHVKTRQLVGVLIMVFVRKEIVGEVRALSAALVKLGYGGMTGNKGAIGVRLELGGTSLCFVCAHLAAGQSHVEERNSNWHDAQSGLLFGKRQQWSVDSHDLSFWLGDFNYRIDMPRDEIIERVANGELKPLLAYDQLLLERAAGRTFDGYREGALSFSPTYKYDVGTDTYDTSEKARAPAWTDRVLYKIASHSIDHLNVELLDYSRSELRASDHKPIRAMFKVGVRYVDEKKRRQVSNAVRRELAAGNGVVGIDQQDIEAIVAKQEERRQSAANSHKPLLDLEDGEANSNEEEIVDNSESSDEEEEDEEDAESSENGQVADSTKNIAAPLISFDDEDNSNIDWARNTFSPPKLDNQQTWAVSRADCTRFAGIFANTDIDKDGFVSGAEARPVFMRSNLPTADLAAIWALCNTSGTGKLNVRQFALGLWLCNARLHGAELPKQLPPRLIASIQAGGFVFQ